jgi:tetratricopeptide (TPR) repeat protein
VRSRKRLAGIFLFLVIAGFFAYPPLSAWYHLSKGRTELEKYHLASARSHLETCLETWPNHFEARFLLSRCARRMNDFDSATMQLRELQQRNPNEREDDVLFEWALLKASMGDFDEVEPFLYEQIDKNPDRAPLGLEALTVGYLRLHRIVTAGSCTDHWLKLHPDHLIGLILQGDVWRRGKIPQKAITSYTRVLELDPEQHDSRWQLALSLLDVGGYEEALSNLEKLLSLRPDDPEVISRIARCQHVLGRTKEARELLEVAYAKHPTNLSVLRTRGQIELMTGNNSDAEKWFREADALQPNDYSTIYSLAKALHNRGKLEESKQLTAQAEKLKEVHEKIHEIVTRKMSETPNDPKLHCELGVLYHLVGIEEPAERWLLSALKKNPNLPEAHETLAQIYDANGKSEQATFHREQAKRLPSEKPKGK